jgi:RNA polymerase sigma-70 factor (ECF subfamily)
MDEFGELLVAAQAGDERAFTALFRRTNPVVVRYLTVLSDADAAQDFAAETWIAALRNFATFSGDERAFRGWLLTIARARWVDGVRRQYRRPELVTDELPDAVTPDAADVAGEHFSTQAAVELIARLPPDLAEVITLRVIAELDVAEVARLTSRTANHVRVLTHRGLKRLATMLGEVLPDDL